MITCERCGREFDSARRYSAHSARNCDLALSTKRIADEDLMVISGDDSIALNRAGIPFRYESFAKRYIHPDKDTAKEVAKYAVAPRWAVLVYGSICSPMLGQIPGQEGELRQLLRLVIERCKTDEEFREAVATICEATFGLGPYLIVAGITPDLWVEPPPCPRCNHTFSWSHDDGWTCNGCRGRPA